jgi:hypothetical protein
VSGHAGRAAFVGWKEVFVGNIQGLVGTELSRTSRLAQPSKCFLGDHR